MTVWKTALPPAGRTSATECECPDTWMLPSGQAEAATRPVVSRLARSLVSSKDHRATIDPRTKTVMKMKGQRSRAFDLRANGDPDTGIKYKIWS